MKFFKENQPVVDKVFELKINAPIPITDFVFSSVNSSGIFLYDTRYDLKASVALYDSYLNSLEQNFQGNFIKSYVWDYKSLFPVAEVLNAPVSAVAYTSFEDEGIGN